MAAVIRRMAPEEIGRLVPGGADEGLIAPGEGGVIAGHIAWTWVSDIDRGGERYAWVHTLYSTGDDPTLAARLIQRARAAIRAELGYLRAQFVAMADNPHMMCLLDRRGHRLAGYLIECDERT